MRIIAIVFNFFAIVVNISLIFELSQLLSGEWLLYPFLIGAIINLIVLFGSKDNTNWLSLYIRRKMLEEEKKIEELTKHKSATSEKSDSSAR